MQSGQAVRGPRRGPGRDRPAYGAAGRSNLPLVVTGEAGIGKSALLAHSALAYRAAHPGEIVILHFVGSSPASCEPAAILQRLLGELKRQAGIRDPLPDERGALLPALANWLRRAVARQPVTLVLGGLEALEERDGGQELVWLPEDFPPGVRVLLSSGGGRSLEVAARAGRSWPWLSEPARARRTDRRDAQDLRQDAVDGASGAGGGPHRQPALPARAAGGAAGFRQLRGAGPPDRSLPGRGPARLSCTTGCWTGWKETTRGRTPGW